MCGAEGSLPEKKAGEGASCNYAEMLRRMADPAYADFQSPLIPTVARERVLGVRMPELRALAKRLASDKDKEEFYRALPHTYYDEDNLHGCLIAGERDFDRVIGLLDAFLPHIDNWATCDMLSPAVFRSHREALLPHIRRWMASDHLYTCRFGILNLMRHYLDKDFREEYPALVAAIPTEDYYLETMVAWYFATALAKQYEATIPYIRERRLSPGAHRRAIRKARESLRLTAEQKAYLFSLR